MEYSRSFKGIAFATVSVLRRLRVYYNLWRVQEFHARLSNSRSALIECRNVNCFYPTIRTESTSTVMIEFSKIIFKAEKFSTQPISKNCEAEICKEEKDYVDIEGVDGRTFDSICDLVRLQQWDLLKEMSAKLTPSIVVQALAVKYASAGLTFQLFHLLEKEGNIQETLQIYSAMIHILIRAKMFSEARALMDCFILSSKCHASASDIFRSLISTYSGFSVPVALDMLIKTYARFNMIQDATDIFQQSSNCTFANDVTFCNRLLKVIIKMQLPDLVFKIFKEMQKRRIRPNIDTWNCVLEAYCEKGNLPRANNFVCRMHQTGTVPDGVTYDLLIDGYCKESRITEAHELMKHMILHEGIVPGIKAYNALIRGLCKVGNLQEANSLLQQIHQNGVKPSPEIYAALIEAHLRHWRICSAIKLHEQMLEHDLLLDKATYRSIITILCNFEMVEETSNLILLTMERELVPAKTIFSAMLKSNYLKDNAEQLKRILNKAMEEGIELSIATYTTLIEGFYKGGMLQEASEWFKEMQKRGLTPKKSSYVKLIYGHCKEGNSRIGLKLLEEMIQKGFSPTISVYEKIVIGLCVDNEIHEARNLARQMLRRSLILEINTYARIIHWYLQEGNMQEAVVLMEEILGKGIIPKSEICVPTESCHALHPSQFMTLYHATEQLQPAFRDLLITLCNNPTAQWPAPACVIGDMFTGWLQETANSLGIPGFTFFTSPAYGTLVYNSLWYHLPHNNGGLQEDGTVRLPDLPAWLPLARSDLSRRQLEATRSDPWRLFVCRQVEKNALSEGFIINAFSELEPQVIEYLSKSSGKPVWTVGPVVPFDFVGDNEEDKSCLEWLNKQSAGSVVYVSFGSRNFLSPAQVKEVAAGLQESGKPFLWVLRTPPGDESSESLAEGEIAGGRGLVIRGWAPQMQILSHSSTGAFVSHCGWNSMSESIINGVPLICWPMAGEQFLNAKWVVEELGVAVQLPRREDGFVLREQLQTVMRFVMEEEGRDLRLKVSQLAQRARAAIADGGSSAKNLDSLVDHISSLQTI